MKHFDSNYIVYPDGRVYSVRRGIFLKQTIDKQGYIKVPIYQKWYFVHRLVAELYITNPNNLPQVNHKNLNKSDNKVENLEWVTCRQNVNHRYKSKFPGVQLIKSGKYKVMIWHNKKNVYLGLFDTPEEAHQAYLNALALYTS
jgi:hypothetical protein